MKQTSSQRWYWLFLLVFALNACTGVVIKPPGEDGQAAYQERNGRLSAIDRWGLAGKISLDDGDQGGSGKLRWNVGPGQSEMGFSGAMGRGAWQLQMGPDGALLKMADGTEQAAADVSDLISEHIGWPVPLDALQWWARGLAAPGATESEQFGPDGLLTSLQQFGWSVSFSRYDSIGDMELPVRLNATRENYRVKLAVSRWRLEMIDDSAN